MVLDTDVASYILNGNQEFGRPYAEMVRGYRLHLSFMTVAEMRRGSLEATWGQRKCDSLEDYLAGFQVHHSDNRLCSLWAEVRSISRRKGRRMETADAWIASTALALSLPLVTNNHNDFRHLDQLQVISIAV